MNNNSTFVQIGVGWLKTNKDGKEFVSGTLADKKSKLKVFVEDENGQVVQMGNIFMFFNESKQKDTHPDVRFMVSPPREQE